MKRLAVVDLLFRWPPDGGARVDLKETVARLAKIYRVKLFVPRIRCIVDRGAIEEPVPFEVVPIPFTRKEFTGPMIEERFRRALAAFKPDLVFLADGFHMKPWAARAVRDYPYFLKFYAYENLCQRYNGIFMRGDRSCYRTGAGASLPDQLFCTACGFKAARMSRKHDGGDVYHEFMGAGAWRLSYWRRVTDMLDRADKIIVYNRMLQNILALHGWRSTVIPAGLDTSLFPFKPPRTPDGTVRLGVVGRLRDEQKGVVTAVRAMSELQQRGIDVELHITGTREDNPRALPGVIFRGWFERDQLHRFYESVDIVIVPSIWQEPFGIITLEAMCSGRPVVASRVAGPREIIRHGVNGRLSAPQSALDLADQVTWYLTHPEPMAEIVENARNTVRELYTWDTIVNTHYLPLIQSMLDAAKTT